MYGNQMTNVSEVKAFALAGNATLTLKSKRSGTRFTYKIRQPSQDKPHFVSLLRGQDNEGDYTFFGTVFQDGSFKHGRRSSLAEAAPGPAAFRWFWKNLTSNHLHPELEVWHEGRCGRCGRKLTVPESIANGIGPECIKHM